MAHNSDNPPTPPIDHDVIRGLAKLLDETGLTEIEFERDGVSVRVARYASDPVGRARAAESALTPQPGVTSVSAAMDPAQHPGVVASPMVGTAYLAPSPGDRPFVDVGATVKVGDPLMKIGRAHV